jgi:putative oxidoreductase
MPSTATGHLPNVGTTRGKALNVTLWVVQALLALAFAGAGSGKAMGTPETGALFEAVGIGQWFRYVTGILEVTGAVLVVVPKTRSVGAALFIPIMLGATAANIALHTTPIPPLVLLVLSSFVVWGRRRELAQFVPASAARRKTI